MLVFVCYVVIVLNKFKCLPYYININVEPSKPNRKSFNWWKVSLEIYCGKLLLGIRFHNTVNIDSQDATEILQDILYNLTYPYIVSFPLFLTLQRPHMCHESWIINNIVGSYAKIKYMMLSLSVLIGLFVLINKS